MSANPEQPSMLMEIEAGLVLIERLSVLIPVWIERARAAGELTQEQETNYQNRQAAVFCRRSAQIIANETDSTQPS